MRPAGLAAGLFVGATVTVSRRSRVHAPGTAMSACSFLGALVAGACAAVYVSATHTELLPPGIRPTFFLIMAADGAGVTLLSLSLFLAPKFISGAEVALVLLLEVVLGPLFVGIGLHVVPPLWTILSAALLLTALALHEAWGLVCGSHEEPKADGGRGAAAKAPPPTEKSRLLLP